MSGHARGVAGAGGVHTRTVTGAYCRHTQSGGPTANRKDQASCGTLAAIRPQLLVHTLLGLTTGAVETSAGSQAGVFRYIAGGPSF